MNINNIKTIYDHCEQNKVSFVYNGPVWQKLIEEIADIVESKSSLLPPRLQQKTMLLYIEQIQNILHYSENVISFHGEDRKEGSVIVGGGEGELFLISSNIVSEEKKKKLQQKLDTIIQMDREELESFFRKSRREEKLSPESQGAGLGLIEMARTTKKSIEYSFTPYENNLYKYSLKITL